MHRSHCTTMIRAVFLLFIWSSPALSNPIGKCENNPERLLCHNIDLDKIVLQIESESWNVSRLWIRTPPTMKTILNSQLLQLPALNNIDIHNSQIESLEARTFAGTNISIVDIRLTPIQNVSPQLLQDSSVDILFFQEHRNLTIPENQPFLESTTLESLYMDYCDIKKVFRETFKRLPQLSTLSLMDNQLTVLPDGLFADNPLLSNLFLERNKLTTLNLEQFSPTSLNSEKLSIYLERNPWECDARLKPLMTLTTVKINMEGTECANPKGKNWAQAVEILRQQANETAASN